MGFICSICTDSLEKAPSDIPLEEQQQRQHLRSNSCKSSNSNQLCAAPCGHLYHRLCLEKWMGSGAPGPSSSNSSCPNCRVRIRRGSCLDLFPDSYDDSSPLSPGDYKAKADQHEKDIAAISSKLYNVEADFKIQLNLYNLLATDHQKQDLHFREEIRKKELEISTLKTEGENARHNLEVEVQKLKAELENTNRKLESEKGQRLGESTMTSGFFQTIASKLEDFKQQVQLYSLNFQRDPVSIKTSPNPPDDSKPGPSRLCKPYKGKGLGRPSVLFSKPRRGKKMFYERGPEAEEIEEVDLEEEESDDDDDLDVMAGPDSRKRKLICVRTLCKNSDIPKLKIKRTLSNDLSLSPICLTLSSDEDETATEPPANASSCTSTPATADPNDAEATMDITEGDNTEDENTESDP